MRFRDRKGFIGYQLEEKIKGWCLPYGAEPDRSLAPIIDVLFEAGWPYMIHLFTSIMTFVEGKKVAGSMLTKVFALLLSKDDRLIFPDDSDFRFNPECEYCYILNLDRLTLDVSMMVNGNSVEIGNFDYTSYDKPAQLLSEIRNLMYPHLQEKKLQPPHAIMYSVAD